MTSSQTAAAELKLPLLGDVMTEGTLVAWLQPDGAILQPGDPLYQLETDKVSFTVEAPSAGRLERLVAEGETVPVGTVVGRLLDSAAAIAAAEPESASDEEVRASPAARRLASQRGVDLAAIGTGRRLREADVQRYIETTRGDDGPAQPVADATDAQAASDAAEVRATPAARALARQLGVSLAAVGTGRRLREADIRSFHETQTRSAAAVEATAVGAPLAGRRKVIAERMRASLGQMAQLTIALEVDMTEANRFRDQLKQLLPDDSLPTVTDLVIRAAVLALVEHPALNATLQDGRLTLHDAAHVGVAVDAADGLIVPVLRDAAAVPLRQLGARTRELADKARANQLTPEDVQGGTFTITSLGTLGIDFFTPIINPPQVAILGIGRIFPKLTLADGVRVEERAAMYLNLSFDHQAVDGAPAARFLQAVKRLLELPASLVV